MILEIKQKIIPRKWINCKNTKRLFAALQGGIPDSEPQALFVGGCVRNAIMDVEVEDIDIATKLSPEHVIEILKRENIKVIPTGLKHGTVTAIIDGNSYEITTLRHDLKTDGRHAEVAFTDSWAEDAKRRDFTINTLLMDCKGNVYDPLGTGIDDIAQRRVVFVGNPKKRIEEDHLRILRFFRFSAIYANNFDLEGLKACEKAADKIKKLSKERITQEFFKIIASDRPYDVLEVMFRHKILNFFKFCDYNPEFFKYFCKFQSKYRLNALSSRLFVFAALNFENIKSMEEFILFPKVFLKDMKAINRALKLPDLSCDHAVRVSVYRFGRSITAQSLIIELVQDRVINGYVPKALNIIQNWNIPDFPITGENLIAKGIPQGRELGYELNRLEQKWIDNDFKDID